MVKLAIAPKPRLAPPSGEGGLATVPMHDAATVRGALPWPALIDALREAFQGAFVAPDRHIHDLDVPGAPHATALLMPAWIEGDVYGVKLANIFPGNADAGRPAVNAAYVLFSAVTGEMLAIMDGVEITTRRTVATSALAASMLARPDARRLLVIGTGRIGPLAVEAFASIRSFEVIEIWGRDPAKAAAIARDLQRSTGLPVAPAADLRASVETADIVSCATLSTEPIVRGHWLKPGAHLDLIGAFRPTMRECDDEAVRRAAVYIDTHGGARAEAGDLIQAVAAGAFAWSAVVGDLAALCKGVVTAPVDPDQITLFKSVGASIEDLAAARLVHRAASRP